MKSLFTICKLLAVIMLLALPLGLMAQEKAEEKAEEKVSPAPKPTGAVTNVETLELISRQLNVHSSYVGHLEPLERVVIRSEAEGRVEKVYLDEGQKVKTGDVLVNISTERLSLSLKLAEANSKLSESEFQTEKLLFDRSVSTASKVDSFRTKRDVDKISLEIAKLDFDKSQVKSPISGVIKKKIVGVGAYVNRGQNLFEIMDISQVLVLINIPEKEMRFVTPGKDVKVRIDAIPGTVFNGSVSTLGLEADLKNRSFPAEILLDNSNRQLLPGMMARAEMLTHAEPNEIIIPRYAVLERETNRIVFIEKNGIAIERPVILGTIIKDEVQVLSGLQSGDKLILSGHHFLTSEEAVKVVSQSKQKI